MELKTKYQYTYFIKPYIIQERNYYNYILKLLNDKKCSVKFFEKQKDFDMYSYFLPNIRDFMFTTFYFNNTKIKEFYNLNTSMQATLLSKYPVTVFEYNIGKDVQGKIGETDGLFFNIEKIELICFSTGICFFSMKTNLADSTSFSDVLNFNYKFRDFNSEFSNLKDFENIKIQTATFNDINELSSLISNITGSNSDTQKLNIDTNRFYCYSYVCIDQEFWNSNIPFENIENYFLKYINLSPSNYNNNFDKNYINSNFKILNKWKYIKIGTTKLSTMLFTTSEDNTNFTRLPYIYENQYFYTYILTLYEKIYLQYLNFELYNTKNVKKTLKKLVDFTESLWLQEITSDDSGTLLYKNYQELFELENSYIEIKSKYDMIYKISNIEKYLKSEKFIIIAIIIIIVSIISKWLFFN